MDGLTNDWIEVTDYSSDLTKQVLDFVVRHNMVPVMGAELEFYVEYHDPMLFLQLLAQECQMAGIGLMKIDGEEGESQFEAIFHHTANIAGLAGDIEKFKQLSKKLAKQHQVNVLFDAKPYPDQEGSGLHIHVNLSDDKGNNLLLKQQGQETALMHYMIGGLLGSIADDMDVFAPCDKSKQRYQFSADKKDKKNVTTPYTVSWGGNNRSVAIRIPESTMQEHTRRIEHRVPCANANAYDVVRVIIKAIDYGINEQIVPQTPRVWGNAFDEHYQPQWLV
mgnify:CR=1 FL=1